MAENKRYYWIKLSGDFFRDKLIKKLRQIAGGDTFVICYLKMLILATENDGKLYYDGLEDDFASELALDIDEEVDNVSVTVTYLLRHGILISNDSVEYELLTVKEMSGSESGSARRMRKHRASQCDALSSHCDHIKSKRKEIEPENNRGESESASTPTLEDVRSYVTDNGLSIDADKFYYTYQPQGWRTSAGNPITDWRGLCKRWQLTEAEHWKEDKPRNGYCLGSGQNPEADPRWQSVHYDIE